jgi:hypothetical protein
MDDATMPAKTRRVEHTIGSDEAAWNRLFAAEERPVRFRKAWSGAGLTRSLCLRRWNATTQPAAGCRRMM